MIKKIVTISIFAMSAILVACNNKETKTTASETEKTEKTEKEEPKKEEVKNELVGNVSKPDSVEIEEVDFDGIGKIQSFKGSNWEKSGNQNYNKSLDMTIIIQGQPGDFTSNTGEYTDSYIDVNKRDAPKYEVVDKKEGEIKGVKCVKLDGKFDNGTAYVTRDYLFFHNSKVVMLMCRVAKTNESKLNPYIDYLASTYHK